MNRKDAPTTKVKNHIEDGLRFTNHNGVVICANSSEPLVYEKTDRYSGEVTLEVMGDGFTLSSHDGLMPAFFVEHFVTIQELANAMREHADLRKWCYADNS